MNNILIVGSSGHAKVVIDVVRNEGKYNIVGLLDRFRVVGEKEFGCDVLGAEEDIPDLIKYYDLTGLIVAIGDNYVRSQVVCKIKKIAPLVKFVSTVHPRASVASNVSIGDGSVIMAGVSVNVFSAVGDYCILNTNSSLEHDSVLGNFASLAPGVIMGGNCRIGDYSAICIGVVVINGIDIGEHTVVGAGALVVKSIDSYAVAYGSPARVVRGRKPGDRYL